MKPLMLTKAGTNQDGLNILIISGLHGNELSPIRTTQILTNKVDSELLGNYKSITFVIGVNESGIKSNTREITHESDNNDMNRMFYSDNLNLLESVFKGNKLYESRESVDLLKTIINEFDVVIDIHASEGINEFYLVDNNVYAKSITQFFKSKSIPFAVRPFAGNTLKQYALELGILGFTLEINGLDLIDEKSAERGATLVIQTLRGLQESIFEKQEIDQTINYIYLISHYEGLLSPCTDTYFFKSGEVIFTIENYVGEIIGDIKAPCDGWVLSIPSRSYVTIGLNVCVFQPV